MKVLDIHGAPVSQVHLSDDSGISSMAWSCEKFCMNENRKKSDCEYSNYLSIIKFSQYLNVIQFFQICLSMY